MEKVQELAPGVFLEGDKLYLCPACGMEATSGDPMNEGDVFCWLAATLTALNTLGAQGCDPRQADKITRKWIHEGGHETHAKGGHDVSRN